MTTGVLKIVLFIHGSSSLKEKRMCLHSFEARLRNNFNVAVTQIDDEDKWQKATLAIVGAERDRKNMNSILSSGIGKYKILSYTSPPCFALRSKAGGQENSKRKVVLVP